MAHTGFFRPRNPEKYRGDPSNIVYRSSWEARVMGFLDKNPSILRWSSEEFCVKYVSPKDGIPHRYFPDFWIEKLGPDGEKSVMVVEVKPDHEQRPPKPSKNKKRYLAEVVTYGINQAKWAAAEEFCRARGWKFKVVGESALGIKF